MDIITIFQALFRWGIVALIGGLTVLLVLICCYLIYKKIFHGEKSLTKIQTISICFLCYWIILVFGLTSLSRGSNFTGSFNIDFLSSYISAWNNWSISELQLIIFNMLMFAPLGFLLPLLCEKAKNIWITFLVSFAFTSILEIFQFITGSGIFELDDLFHNVIGSIFGYFCVMAIITIINEKTIRFVPIAKVLFIPCFISLILCVVFYVYEHQPYGNMNILPAVKQDMSKVQIIKKLGTSEQSTTALIYKNRYAEDKNYIETIKLGLGKLENLTFYNSTRREDENLGYTGIDANGNEFQMLFFYRNGEWSYNTFSENIVQLTEEKAQILRRRYENWMNKFNLLPINAEFSIQNGNTLRWTVNPQKFFYKKSEPFQKGSVMIQFDETGSLINFYYQISWNDYIKTENIISESKAYTQIENGNFEQYIPFNIGDKLYINKCEINYVYDTKGFYQPVYQFTGYINNNENIWTCQIPALYKKRY